MNSQHDFILLDRSGSMSTLWAEAIGSVNTYVQNLVKEKVPTRVTLAVFDTGPDGNLDFTILRESARPEDWRNVSTVEVTPRNMTPLNDATGRLVNMALAGNYEKAAIIIMTDGAENASRELSVAQAKALLDQCRNKNWQVIFLGANFDNASQAKGYGTKSFSTVQTSVHNLENTMRSMAGSRAIYSTTGATMGFTEEEKEELKQ